ncbi:unnamed protein product [Prorocentrum cordatum]|uniref:Uncharacterized protein n=1 Tax=Prorocentrum cordatum TaxID=2364126 RepID=A0ABN9PRB0_9DINO|nr:unnamed protein product [Polarella glacialis]
MVLTLGLFCFVRPRDDDAVLVLKRQGRVLLLKTERPDFFSGDLPRVLLRIFQYMLILLVMMSMPVLIGALVTAGPTVDDGDVEVVRIVKSIQQNMDKHLMAMLREKSAEVVTVYVLSILLLLFFMWSTCPHDYGTQYLQSHAAKSIVAGQFGFTGVSFRRRAYLRLYFGRFPDQAVADRSTGLTGGRVCGPVPREELVKAGDQLGRRRQGVGGSRQTSQGGILAFTAMVSVVTVMFDVSCSCNFFFISRGWIATRAWSTWPRSSSSACTRRKRAAAPGRRAPNGRWTKATRLDSASACFGTPTPRAPRSRRTRRGQSAWSMACSLRAAAAA